MNLARIVVSLGTVTLVTLTAGCGKSRSGSDGGPARGRIEQAFINASVQNKIPVRMLMAVARNESGFDARPSDMAYGEKSARQMRGILNAGSAFGLANQELGLSDNNADLEAQINAYARFINARLSSTKLPESPATADEKVRWIWNLAQIHREDDSDAKNLWVIFTREIIEILNSGFEWHDPNSEEIIRFEKESSPILDRDLPYNVQQDLSLSGYSGDTNFPLLKLVPSSPSGTKNNPRRVLVTHCPLSVSACLHLQGDAGTGKNSARLGAHYIVPPAGNVTEKLERANVMQVALHDQPVTITNSAGEDVEISDAIVIMLAGPSGRYAQGVRQYADPTWLSDKQLKLMGATIKAVCERIGKNGQSQRCRTPGVDDGTTFMAYSGENYTWGQVPDFRPDIFYPYVMNAEGTLASATIKLAGGERRVNAGERFSLTVEFQPSVQNLYIQRLVRSESNANQVEWETVYQVQPFNETVKNIEMSWRDAGPNGTGEQFFRAVAKGHGGQLLGWSTYLLRLRGFNKESATAGPRN